MYAAVASVDMYLGTLNSLKEKRAVVRPMITHLHRQFGVAAAEAGHLDVHRSTVIGVAAVAADLRHCQEVLETCTRWLDSQPHVEVVAVRRTYVSQEEMS